MCECYALIRFTYKTDTSYVFPFGYFPIRLSRSISKTSSCPTADDVFRALDCYPPNRPSRLCSSLFLPPPPTILCVPGGYVFPKLDPGLLDLIVQVGIHAFSPSHSLPRFPRFFLPVCTLLDLVESTGHGVYICHGLQTKVRILCLILPPPLYQLVFSPLAMPSDTRFLSFSQFRYRSLLKNLRLVLRPPLPSVASPCGRSRFSRRSTPYAAIKPPVFRQFARHYFFISLIWPFFFGCCFSYDLPPVVHDSVVDFRSPPTRILRLFSISHLTFFQLTSPPPCMSYHAVPQCASRM